jgi:O-acetyl-ADP-ribose deacetylase (regulator of RNase III)
MIIEVRTGDILDAEAHALVNPVNTVGVMGKGAALAFRKRFPDMFEDYVQRCRRKEVQLGHPYPYYTTDGRVIVNFPTKEHWRSVSRLSDIFEGLRYLRANVREWGVRSMAVPALGCGNGQLEWSVVGPVLYRELDMTDIPVTLYVPLGSGVLPVNSPG